MSLSDVSDDPQDAEEASPPGQPEPPPSGRIGPLGVAGLVFILVLVGVSLLQFLTEPAPDPGTDHPLVGQRIPALTLDDLHGEPLPLLDPERPTLIDFWSLTCMPCQRMRPELNLVARREAAHIALRSVNTDPRHPRRDERIAAYVRDHAVASPVVTDDRDDAQITFGVRRIPAVFLVHPDGTVLRAYTGVTSSRTLRAAVAEVSAASAASSPAPEHP